MGHKVTSSMNDKVMDGLTINELWDALTILPKKSCLGEDGLPPSFFIKYWDILKEQLCDAYQLILKTG